MKHLNLASDSREEIVDVLVAAFFDYPAMRYFLKVRGKRYDEHLRVLNRYFVDARLLRNWPVPGVQVHGCVCAVALISPPLNSSPEPLPELRPIVRSVVGQAAWKRMKHFDQMTDATLPQTSHHFLGMLAVHPAYQGKGYGTRLLECVKEMSNSEHSLGVTLTTETEQNVEYYIRHGFDVLGEVDFGELTSWTMRWMNPEFPDQTVE